MTLEQIKEEFKKDTTKKICRECNYRPYHYMPIYFTFKGDVLMIHDMDNFDTYWEKGKPAAFQKSNHTDWILY